jgi:type IV pilus assembly protein PilO
MATKASAASPDVSELLDRAKAQFRDLDTREPGQWPLLPKLAAFVLTGLLVVVLGWLLLMSEAQEQLEAQRDREPQLRTTYRDRLTQAINLEELRKQKLQVEEFVTQLEKQLPGKAEIDQLLSDINQAGLGRGLQFELFRPGQIAVREYYAELPIALRVTGSFHDFGAFAADVANLSRIVTLQSLSITPVQQREGGGQLAMEATAYTYRYLDAAEVAEQRAAARREAGDRRR